MYTTLNDIEEWDKKWKEWDRKIEQQRKNNLARTSKKF